NVVEENVVEENVVEENVVEENVVEENVVEENKQPIINSIASVNAEYSNIKAQPNLHANSVKDVTQTSQQQPPLIKTSPKTNLNVEQILMRLKKARANTDNNLNQVTQGNVEITHNLPNGNLNSNRDAQDNHDSDTDNEIRHNDNTVNVGNDTVVNEKNINPVNTVANPQTSQAFNNAKPTLTNEELAIINKYANKPIAA
nr:hypothetical protein [Rickettsiales bacterium]